MCVIAIKEKGNPEFEESMEGYVERFRGRKGEIGII